MFDTLFSYPKVLTRHQTGPARDERERYLVDRATVDGLAHATLLRIAGELLIVARWIGLGHDGPVTSQDIVSAAQSWADHQLVQGRARDDRWPRQLFRPNGHRLAPLPRSFG
ncbi:hypothetical protein NKH93_32480 [Mesorhizobium sp. M0954]|uniref:hypothetical protein n=1 Tax=Mesorhizobium sp. M0954 TaxID=2957032 RepID=UPI00333B1D9D